MSSHVKTYTFYLDRRNAGRGQGFMFHTTARTLVEAEADFRHHIRTHLPEVLDEVRDWGYRCKVQA